MDLFKCYFTTILDSGETSCTLKDDYIQFTPGENFGSLVSCFHRYYEGRPYVGDLSLSAFHRKRAKELVVLKTDSKTWLEPLHINDFLHIMAYTLCPTDTSQENEPCRRFIEKHEDSFKLLEQIEIQMQTLEERVNKHDDDFHVANKKIAGFSTQQDARFATLESNQGQIQSNMADFTAKLKATEMKFGLEKRKNSRTVDEAACVQLALESRVSKLETSAKSIKALTRAETSSLHTALSETQARVHALENLNAETDERTPVEEEVPPMYSDLGPSRDTLPEDEGPLEDVQSYTLSFAAEMDAISSRITLPNTRDPLLTTDTHPSARCRPTNISEQIKHSQIESLTSYLPSPSKTTLVEDTTVLPCNIINLQRLDICLTETTNRSVDYSEDQCNFSGLSGETGSELQERPVCITAAQSGTTLPRDDVINAVIEESVAASPREARQAPSTPRIVPLVDPLASSIGKDIAVVQSGTIPHDGARELVTFSPPKARQIPSTPGIDPPASSIDEVVVSGAQSPGLREGPAYIIAAQSGTALPHDDVISAITEESVAISPRVARQTPSTPRIDPPASPIDEVVSGTQEEPICMEDDIVRPHDINVTCSIDALVAQSSGLHDVMTTDLNVPSSHEATHSCMTPRIDVSAITPVQGTGDPPSTKDIHFSIHCCSTNIPHPDRIGPSQTEKLECLTSYLPYRKATLVEDAAVLQCNTINPQGFDIRPTETINHSVGCFEDQHRSSSPPGEMVASLVDEVVVSGAQSSRLKEGSMCIAAAQSSTTLPHHDVASAVAGEPIAALPREARQTPSTPRIALLVDPPASLIDEVVVSGPQSSGLQEGPACIESGPALLRDIVSAAADGSVTTPSREARLIPSTPRIDTLAGSITVSVAQSLGLQGKPACIAAGQSSTALQHDVFCAVAVETVAASPRQARQSPSTPRVNTPASPINEAVVSGVQDEGIAVVLQSSTIPHDGPREPVTFSPREARQIPSTPGIDPPASSIDEVVVSAQSFQSLGLREGPACIIAAQSGTALPRDVFCAVTVETVAASPRQARQSPSTPKVNLPASPTNEEVVSGVQEELIRTDDAVLSHDIVADVMTANLTIPLPCEAGSNCTTIGVDIQAGTIKEVGSQSVADDMGALITTSPGPTTEPDPPSSQDSYVSGAYLDTRGIEMTPQVSCVSQTLIIWWLAMCGLALFLNRRSGGMVIKPPVSSFGDGYMINMDIYNELPNNIL